MSEEFETYGALIGLLPRVTPQMNGQMRKLPIALLALRALVRLFSGVNPLMNHQIFSLAKTLPTFRALEFGFILFGVSAQVNLQVSRLTENLIALRALVLFFVVCPSVQNQTAGMTEASLTLRALKEFAAPVVMMAALVTRQIGEFDESSPALGAFVRSLSFVNIPHVFPEASCLSECLQTQTACVRDP